MATQEQLAAQLTALRDSLNTGFATITGKLSEASTEIPAKIQELLAAIGPVAPEVQAIADELSSMVSTFVGTITEQADGLANIVSDAPPTE